MNDLVLLTEQDARQLVAEIKTGVSAVGEKLLQLYEGHGWEVLGYASWRDCVMAEFDFQQSHVYRLLDFARVQRNLSPIGETPLLPANEAQARHLAALPPDVQRDVWQCAVDTAPEGKVTAAHVERIVEATRASQPVEVTIFSHKTVEYYTPPEFLEAARAVLGEIDLDPASCPDAQQNVMANAYYTKEQDGLAQAWNGRVWLNPPYSKTDGRSNQETWSTRLVTEYQSGNVTAAVLLVKAALGYNWFERLWYDWPVCFVRSRLSFIQEDGDNDGQSKQGTAFLYFGPDIERFIEVFREFGRVILPTDGYSTLR